jgi:hypothetical protein
VISFTPPPLCPRGKGPAVPIGWEASWEVDTTPLINKFPIFYESRSGNFDRSTSVRNLHVAFTVLYDCDYITKLLQATSRRDSNQIHMQLEKEKDCVGNIRGLNLVAVKPVTVQVSNCR